MKHMIVGIRIKPDDSVAVYWFADSLVQSRVKVGELYRVTPY